MYVVRVAPMLLLKGLKCNRLPDGASAAGPMLPNLDDQDGTGFSTHAEPWPNPGRTLAEPWPNPGRTLAEPSATPYDL